jgi:ribosomal protein S18 acetylase RimI-like enzyme
MYSYKTLENIELEVIYNTFVEAFSDYQVKFDISFDNFQIMMKRRGLNLDFSMGTFKDGKMVGFILNGVREWNGKTTIYDVGTGVVLEHRKKGVTGAMFKKLLEVCRDKKIEQYLLEVLQENSGAVNLYKGNGFQITREFDCYFLNKFNRSFNKNITLERLDSFSEEIWRELKKYWNYNPSWQNSIDSIKDNFNNFIYIVAKSKDKIVGYGIIEKTTGDIPQIAVSQQYRRQGIGKAIVNMLINSLDIERFKILNIDSRDLEMEKFLLSIGGEKYTKQFEMILEI